MGGPRPSSPAALRRMQRQRRRDTKPELDLRRELHRLGLRYRVDVPVVPAVRRRADVVFTKAHVAVFVDGCFWHRCPEHGTAPSANGEWWASKLDKNVERDRDTDRVLQAAGWSVIRVWEHTDPVDAARNIMQAIEQKSMQRPS